MKINTYAPEIQPDTYILININMQQLRHEAALCRRCLVFEIREYQIMQMLLNPKYCGQALYPNQSSVLFNTASRE